MENVYTTHADWRRRWRSGMPGRRYNRNAWHRFTAPPISPGLINVSSISLKPYACVRIHYGQAWASNLYRTNKPEHDIVKVNIAQLSGKYVSHRISTLITQTERRQSDATIYKICLLRMQLLALYVFVRMCLRLGKVIYVESNDKIPIHSLGKSGSQREREGVHKASLFI